MKVKKTLSQAKSHLTILILAIVIATLLTIASAKTVFASTFIMSPMYEKISLNPGESYTSSLTITTPSANETNFDYKVYIQSYYRDENNNAIFDNIDGHGQMSDWITLNSPETGTLSPNDYATISFTINVPENAPAGGQYAVVTVGSNDNTEKNSEKPGINIQETIAIAYTIYAEITGATIRQGEITDAYVPSFILDGNITGMSSIKNTGNVHGDAIYKLQVYPLFSDEELYTNEENPTNRLVLPNRTIHNEISWDKTPIMGIFNVIYTVEFEGVTTQVSKMVIKCPIWLLSLVIFAITAIIIYFVVRAKSRKRRIE